MKTRFCPSPTGFMHLGNLRTALFSFLFAASLDGQFLLRIEDTDKERSDIRYTKAILQDLEWLGLYWQEGPGCEQGNGPYFQSQRFNIYDKYYQQLEKVGLVYPCFCTKEQLALSRKIQLSSGKPPRYPGTCTKLSEKEIKAKIAAGEPYTLRFRVPEHKTIEFDDFVQGIHKFNSDDIGDFIVRRTDGTPPFMFCNAIDDALMEVTHVVRGADHVANTPNQIMILESLGLSVPRYGHISLIMGYDGTPLSKRHGSSSIAEMREKGYLPGAILNYLARQGHNYEDNSYMTIKELADKFDVDCLSKSSARFDHNQLLHWQKLALAHLSDSEIWQWMGDAVHSLVPLSLRELFTAAVVPNVIFPEDAYFWAQVLFVEIGELDEEKIKIIHTVGKQYYEIALKALGQVGNDYPQILEILKAELSVKGKALFMPLRVALTGETHGPELADIFQLLSVSEIQKRLQYAMSIC
ncbi:MAG: glutamate--tRNA ligase [Gammaproteobacteria bacterium]